MEQLQEYERHFAARKRSRRPDDQATFEATVAAIVCNLAHINLTRSGEAIAITRSNRRLGRRSRYRPPSENKTFPAVLDLMMKPEMDWLTQKLGYRNPSYGPDIHTTIKPSERLIRYLGEYDIELEDIGRSPDEEVIILKSTKEDWNDEGRWIEYEDNADTHRWREEVRSINKRLDEADIDFDPGFTDDNRDADTSNRQVKRRFTNGNFSSGGRLYGGFWMTMRASSRHQGIVIDEQSVREFDYGQMMIRMLYGEIGKTPPPGDLYSLPGVDPNKRDGVKTLVNAMIFSEKPLSRKPKGTAEVLDGGTIIEWMEAVKTAHPELADQFHKGAGHRLQFRESQILIALLLRLDDEGITALPMHDGVIVSYDAGYRTEELMHEVFLEEVGLPAVVTEETSGST